MLSKIYDTEATTVDNMIEQIQESQVKIADSIYGNGLVTKTAIQIRKLKLKKSRKKLKKLPKKNPNIIRIYLNVHLIKKRG